MRKSIIGNFLLLFFIILAEAVSAQSKIDSLHFLLKTDKPDTNRLKHLYQLSDEYEVEDNYDEGLKFGRMAIALADTIIRETKNEAVKRCALKNKASAHNNIGVICFNESNYPEAIRNYFACLQIRAGMGDTKGVGDSYNNIGNVYDNQSNYPEALKYYFFSLKKRTEALDSSGIAGSYNNIGIIYKQQGLFPEALKYYFASLKIKEALKDKKGIAASYNNIGSVYYLQKNYKEALKNHEASLRIRKEMGHKAGQAVSFNNIGIIHEALGNFTEALNFYHESIKMRKAIDDKRGVATSYNNIGIVYSDLGRYEDALDNHLASLKIRKDIGDQSGICISYINLGDVSVMLKKFNEASGYLQSAKTLSAKIGYTACLQDVYLGLANLDSARGNFKGAYQNHKMYILYRDSIDNEETRKQTVQNQMTYDFEKKEAVAKAEHKKELENQQLLAGEKSRKQRFVIIAVAFGLILVLIFAVFIFRSLRLTKKQKRLIEQQKEIVEKQKKEVEHQKMIVEEHQKEIIDSIMYARRIQHSQLPTEKYINDSMRRLKDR